VPRKPGVVAKFNGVCSRCHLPIIAKADRIIMRGEDAHHVECSAGYDDVQTHPKVGTVKSSPAVGETPAEASTPAGGADPMPAAGDPPLGQRADEWKVTEPGLVHDMPSKAYHDDPYVGGSVSNSDAKLILKAPALYRWKRDNPGSDGTTAKNLGSAAHTRVLGAGDELVKINDSEYRKDATKAARDKALAEGKIPLLGVAKPGKVCEWDVVDQMAKVLETHPLAPLLFAQGAAEVSAFYVCPETGVRRRCRFDFLPNKVDGQRLIVPDYKSTVDADPDRFGKHAADFGYDMADYTYTAALAALGIDSDARFVFVNQETTAPYLVSLTELNDRDREVGRSKTLRALRRYQACMETDTWPGYIPVIHKVSLPSWAHITEERTLMQEGLI
jgi:hypothetical protein